MESVTESLKKYVPTETRFLWEGSRLLAEFNGDRTQVYAYSDQNSYAPLARIDGNGDNSQLYYFHNRLNGQPEAMTDSEGNERWRGKPDGWGKVKGETPEREIKSGGPQNLRMQGQYLDRETGLHYNLHRYYDPDSGRFTQHDPIGLAGGINLYAYVKNPLTWIDPLGLAGCPTFNSRNEALRVAKRDAGIPMNQHPDVVFSTKNQRMQQFNQEMMTGKHGNPVLNSSKKTIWTRVYQYTRSDGSKVIIQDHSAGHDFGEGGIGNQGPHINVRPIDNTRAGSVPGTLDHYGFGGFNHVLD